MMKWNFIIFIGLIIASRLHYHSIIWLRHWWSATSSVIKGQRNFVASSSLHRQQLICAKIEALNTALLHQTPKIEAHNPRALLTEPRIEIWTKQLKDFFTTLSLTKFRWWSRKLLSSSVSVSLHHFIIWLHHWWSGTSSSSWWRWWSVDKVTKCFEMHVAGCQCYLTPAIALPRPSA